MADRPHVLATLERTGPVALAPTDRAVRDLLPAVVRHLPVGIGVVRPDRSIAYGNAAFVRIVDPLARDTGPGRMAALRRRGGRRFDTDDDPIDRALRDSTTVRRHDVAVRTPDGRVTDADLTLVPLTRDAATVVGLLVYLEPEGPGPTDRQPAPSLQEAVVGVLSHELRTPITSIYGGTQLLLHGRVPRDQIAAVLRDIASEADHLHRLVEDLLALARTERGMPPAGSAPVLLQHVAADAARAEERRWPGRRVLIHAEPDLPPVDADDGDVVQVLRNLIANAIRSGSDREPVLVTVAAIGDQVITSVLDRGPGFPAAAGPDAFRLFHGHPEVAVAVPGTGIGLFVARALVEAQGGTIWIRDRPGGGSVVSFGLPRSEVGAPD